MKCPLIFLCTLCLFAAPRSGLAQCGSAPIAPATCSGGNGAATSGTNINSGNTYWFSGGPSTFASLNLNSGGTFRVCGTLTVSSMNYNGGTLIVESGGNLTIDGSFNVSNVTIINRGSLTINGSLTLQGTTNYLYNDLSTSVFTITGAGNFTLDGSSYVINRGMITAGKLLIQSVAGSVCMQDNSMLSLTELDNDVTDGITYSGSGAPACLNVSTTADLNNDVTNSSLVHVCTNTTPTGGASSDGTHGWGSATVTTGCTSCATVLSLTAISLTGTMQGGEAALQWATAGEPSGNDIFYIQRSLDGGDFSIIAQVEARDDQENYQATDPDIISSIQYYRVRWVSALTGASIYSPVTAIATNFNEPFRVYPNPIGEGQVINVLLSSSVAGKAVLSLIDPAGHTVNRRSVTLTTGNNALSWESGDLAAGVYFLSIVMPAGNTLYRRLVITP